MGINEPWYPYKKKSTAYIQDWLGRGNVLSLSPLQCPRFFTPERKSVWLLNGDLQDLLSKLLPLYLFFLLQRKCIPLRKLGFCTELRGEENGLPGSSLSFWRLLLYLSSTPNAWVFSWCFGVTIYFPSALWRKLTHSVNLLYIALL